MANVHSTGTDDMVYVEMPTHTDRWMMGDRFGWAGPEYNVYTRHCTIAYRRVTLVRSGCTIAVPAAELVGREVK